MDGLFPLLGFVCSVLSGALLMYAFHVQHVKGMRQATVASTPRLLQRGYTVQIPVTRANKKHVPDTWIRMRSRSVEETGAITHSW